MIILSREQINVLVLTCTVIQKCFAYTDKIQTEKKTGNVTAIGVCINMDVPGISNSHKFTSGFRNANETYHCHIAQPHFRKVPTKTRIQVKQLWWEKRRQGRRKNMAASKNNKKEKKNALVLPCTVIMKGSLNWQSINWNRYKKVKNVIALGEHTQSTYIWMYAWILA